MCFVIDGGNVHFSALNHVSLVIGARTHVGCTAEPSATAGSLASCLRTDGVRHFLCGSRVQPHVQRKQASAGLGNKV